MEKTNSMFGESEEDSSIPTEGVKCPDCDRVFSTMSGVRMHKARVHDRTVIARGEELSPEAREERRLKAKREYQRKLREKNRARGLTSRGKPYEGGARGMVQWTPEQHKKFRATIKRKQKAKVQYVYPTPEAEQEQVPVPTLKHCPACGEHLAGWKYKP